MSNSLWPHGLNSLPGSCVFVISQARILEWVAISSSRGSSRLRDGTCVSFIGRWILSHQGSHRCSMMRKVEKYKQWMLYLQSLSFAKSDALHHHSSRGFLFFFLEEAEGDWTQALSPNSFSACFSLFPRTALPWSAQICMLLIISSMSLHTLSLLLPFSSVGYTSSTCTFQTSA